MTGVLTRLREETHKEAGASPAVRSHTQAALVARDVVTQWHRLDGMKTPSQLWLLGVGSGGVGWWVRPGGPEGQWAPASLLASGGR